MISTISPGEFRYITLVSADEPDGIVIVEPHFEKLGRIERLDLLNDWIGMLRALYDQEISRGEVDWPDICRADTRGYTGPAEAF